MQTANACLALADGTVFRGHGFGAEGMAVGELCFNTAMTGYQEIMTDPSYAGQIILFTFPHIGNVGVNAQDDEASTTAAEGMVVRELPTAPSNWRSTGSLATWLEERGRIGIAGIDTRRLTRLIRSRGMPHAAICHNPRCDIVPDDVVRAARAFRGIQDADLAREVTRSKSGTWGDEARWAWRQGFRRQAGKRRVVVLDYGAKRNILRSLAAAGCMGEVLPAMATAEQVLSTNPDGVFLSNGPGDPAATGKYAVPMIREVLARGIPIFGICLGHQMLGIALGARTVKMPHGHHGANHPVQELSTGRVSVVSMNHGFALDPETLPTEVEETHLSLFDRSNCGIRAKNRPVFSVQFHPEASPGPQDNFGLFDRFALMIDQAKAGA